MIRHESKASLEDVPYCPHCGGKLVQFDELVYGNVVLKETDKVLLDGKLVPLTSIQYSIVDALVRAKGKGVTRATLAMIIEREVLDEAVTKHIQRIRLTFLSILPQFDQLKVMRGFGAYRWEFRSM